MEPWVHSNDLIQIAETSGIQISTKRLDLGNLELITGGHRPILVGSGYQIRHFGKLLIRIGDGHFTIWHDYHTFRVDVTIAPSATHGSGVGNGYLVTAHSRLCEMLTSGSSDPMGESRNPARFESMRTMCEFGSFRVSLPKLNWRF